MGSRRAPPEESPFVVSATQGPGEDLRNLILDLREEMRSQFAPQGPPLKTLTELAAAWLPRKLRTIAAPETFEGRVRLHLLPALGHHTYATLKKRDVEDFLHLLTTRQGRLSEQTANHIRDAGRQLVRDALDNGEWLGPNPFEQAAKLDIPEKEPDVLNRAEAARFLRWGVKKDLRPLFALALYLGPRRGTIFNIEREHFHPAEKLIDFHVTKTGKKQLGVPVPDELMPYLDEALAASAGSRWLFCRPNRLQFSPKSHILNDALADALERAEIKRRGRDLALTFHGLRRVSSCLHQEAGCHPWVVSKVLGHSQASLAMMGNPTENMTARKYTRFTEEFVRTQLNRLSLKLT